MSNELGKVKLIGIGGSGMLPLALLLKEAGYQVQGTDSYLSDKSRSLLFERGIEIVNQEQSANFENVQFVVMSPAIPTHHPVVRAARRAGVDVVLRSKALAQLIRGRSAICVSGSHGKSTTTAMLMHIMREADLPFGHMLGATFSEMPPAHLDSTRSPFILEACEAHGALHDWRPSHAIVTNIGDEHASHYGGLKGLKTEFLNFINRVENDGAIVLCGDDAGTRQLAEKRSSCVTYGFENHNRLQAIIRPGESHLLLMDGHCVGTLTLLIHGQHNVLNAMAAYAMAIQLGVTSANALYSLSRFTGVERRFQHIGLDKGPFIVDDFAHHPTEIAASLNTAKALCAGRVIAVFQPQLHSRVREQSPAFAQALAIADRRLVLPVEGLGETVNLNDSDTTDTILSKSCGDAAVAIESLSNVHGVIEALTFDLKKDDYVVVMAGRSGDDIAQKVLKACVQQQIPASPVHSILYGRQVANNLNFLTSFIARAAAAPEAMAVQMGSNSLTYGELTAKSADLAIVLRSEGVTAQQTVAVCLGRSMDRVVAFLAILRLGAIYLPLDPAQPAIRLEWMLRESQATVVIVNSASPALPTQDLKFVNCIALTRRDYKSSDFDTPAFYRADFCATALAYLIFTSGSTGHPKGVQISHSSLANYAAAANEHFALHAQARVSLVSGFGFDVSVGDMVMALMAGACLILPTDLQATPGAPLTRFIAQAKITHLSITPSLLSVMPVSELPALTTIIVAGEVCDQALVERWAPSRNFINAYGPTEATIEATFYRCLPGQTVTIGRPFDNVGACILDDQLRLVPAGQEGELCLFGAGLSRGYLNQPELTESRFVVVNFPNQTKQRIYRTGDRALLDSSGNFQCFGRQDNQFKFHGYRIEPAEIESVICRYPHIQSAVVSKMVTHSGERLIAHLVIDAASTALDHAGLRAHLAAHLPDYMHPASLLPLHDMPRTANGKIDRSALPLPPSLLSPRAARKPRTATEEKIFALVKDFDCGKTIYGIRDSLQGGGFDSLALANLLVSIEATFEVTLDISLKEGSDTIETLGLAVDLQRVAAREPPSEDRKGQLIARLRPHLASWAGDRMGQQGLIRCLQDHSTARFKLFWCFQSGGEFSALTEALSQDLHALDTTLFGLRSGHLAFDYDPITVKALAALYADEIESVATSDPIILGGNCQGGMIAREVAIELHKRARTVELTILMEQGQFQPLSGKVLLLFGARSYLNPYALLDAPEQLFKHAYPDGFRIEMLPGGHGEYFRPQNVQVLAAIIKTQVKNFRI